MSIHIDNIETVIDAIKRGETVIITDDENRENEGDLYIPASKTTPEVINLWQLTVKG